MIASLLLAAAADPAGTPPGPVERAFESRLASATSREDGAALPTLLAGAEDLLPSILDRWCLAALAREPVDREAVARIERVASAARIQGPPPLRIPPERL